MMLIFFHIFLFFVFLSNFIEISLSLYSSPFFVSSSIRIFLICKNSLNPGMFLLLFYGSVK